MTWHPRTLYWLLVLVREYLETLEYFVSSKYPKVFLLLKHVEILKLTNSFLQYMITKANKSNITVISKRE